MSFLMGMPLPSALRALRSRNYRLFVVGQLISLVGTWMQSVAQSWLIYRLTGSAALLGLIGFAGQIPIFVLAPLGGLLADRLNRHRVLIATQTIMMVLAFALAALTLGGIVREWQIFVLASLLGVVNAFDIPTRQAFLAETVSRDDIVNAIALNSSMLNGARIVGPAIAGLVVAAFGEGWCFLLNAISYLAVIGALLMMHVEQVPHPGAHVSAWESIIEGFVYSWNTEPVRALLLLLGLVSLMGMPYSVLMPVIASSVLGGGPNAYGVLMAASGVGALAGAALLTLRQNVRGLGRWVAVSAVSFGITLIAFSFSRALWLSTALLVPAGFFMMVEMAASNTLIQSMIPNRLRGRVMSVYSMMFMGMAPMGALVSGALAAPLGAPATYRVCAARPGN
ncbi:MAG: MFS transporter [Acidobacteria bacterium]|nr:MFS transporter [Acidobacteriota bacterium]